MEIKGTLDAQALYALVDSGCEYTLVQRWVAQTVGIDHEGGDEISLGIGGETVKVTAADAILRFGPPESEPYHWEEWEATVGIVEAWKAQWPVVLGERGFFDQYTVEMMRFSQALAIHDAEEFDRRYPPSSREAPPDVPALYSKCRNLTSLRWRSSQVSSFSERSEMKSASAPAGILLHDPIRIEERAPEDTSS